MQCRMPSNANAVERSRRRLSSTLNAYSRENVIQVRPEEIRTQQNHFTGATRKTNSLLVAAERLGRKQWVTNRNEEAEILNIQQNLFWNTLVYVAHMANFLPDFENSTKIGNFGCGFDEIYETLILAQYFGGMDPLLNKEAFDSKGYLPDDVVAIAADADKSKTSTFYRRYLHSLDSEIVREVNASMLNLSSNHINLATTNVATDRFVDLMIENSFDVILFRHQHASFGTSVWERIINNGARLLKPGGLMIVTSYSNDEKDLLFDSQEISHERITYDTLPQNPFAFGGDDRIITYGVKQ